jgi:predicted RNA-binding Zn-ribbon protein involved in translation (DUF1610 family)
MIGETNGGDKFTVRTCPQCGKSVVVTKEMVRGGSYVYEEPKKRKRFYLCGWKCFRQYKYDRILEKKKPTIDDVMWLRFARFPVPEKMLKQWED